MNISIDPRRTRGRVPALRGLYLGDSDEPFVEEDVARLRDEVGVTCLRLGADPLSLSEEADEVYHEGGFAYLRSLLDWCERSRVGAVIDLHNALGRLYGGDPRLWRERPFQDRFVGLWEQLVRRFMDHPAVVAYELINEPEPPDGDFAVWNSLQQRTTEAVRRLDPYRTIIVDSIGYANPHWFAKLALSGDPNTVYSFHNYQPGPYHCQKRRELADQSTYYYPGFIPAVAPERPQDFDQAHAGAAEGKFWNRRQLVEEWGEVFAFRDRHQVPLFCGEFGCVSDVPEMTDMIYLMDEISLLHEQGIHWTLYNAMWRTSQPYWREHFDCCLYVHYSPAHEVHRFTRKIDLIRFFCATEGEVLDLAQPDDEFVGLYGLRRDDGGLEVLVSNKDRESRKTVRVAVQGVPAQWSVSLRTMERGDGGFVLRPHQPLTGGALDLSLPPLSLSLLSVPAPHGGLWIRPAGRQ